VINPLAWIIDISKELILHGHTRRRRKGDYLKGLALQEILSLFPFSINLKPCLALLPGVSPAQNFVPLSSHLPGDLPLMAGLVFSRGELLSSFLI
jgi:hypothetical protein